MSGTGFLRGSPSKRDVLEAITTVLADPHALVDAISLSDSDAEAIASLQATFSLSAEQASAVMDQRFSLMTRSKVVSLKNELHVELEP